MSDKLIEIIKDCVGDDFGDAMKCIFIAEGKIKEFQEKYPQHKEKIFKSFKILYPHDILAGHLTLYPGHCEEMLQRIVDDEDINVATMAELCVIFSEMSLKAPLRENYARAYEYCFNKAFNKDSDNFQESYPGETIEIIDGIKKQTKKDFKR